MREYRQRVSIVARDATSVAHDGTPEKLLTVPGIVCRWIVLTQGTILLQHERVRSGTGASSKHDVA